MQQINKTSENLENENLGKLQKVFPEFVKDGIIDFHALKAFFEKDGKLPENQEKYGLNWTGKSDAFRAIKTPATGTLTPDQKESKDFDKSENIFIEGDNLEVLKLLQKHYREKIKMIYIDPPYNTGKDFIYKDNFTEDKSDYYERTGQNSGGIPMTTNRDSSGRYHSDWLTMMYPRLFLARNLLKEDGVIFISIDDNEVANLRLTMDEIFGEENFIACLVWEKKKKGSFLSNDVTNVKEYIIVYCKSLENFAGLVGEINSEIETYPCINPSNKREIRIIPAGVKSKFRQKNYKLEAGTKISVSTMDIVYLTDLVIEDGVLSQDVKVEGNWRYTQDSLNQFASKDSLYLTEDLYLRRIVSDSRYKTIKDLLSRVGEEKNGFNPDNLFADGWGSNEDGNNEMIELLGNKAVFDYSKPSKLIKKLATSTRDESALILDFFAGTGTTAHAVMDLNTKDGGNRKWICVQLPEMTDENSEARKAGFTNIAQIARERIRRVGDKIAKENEGKLPINKESDTENLDIGFKAYTLSKSNYREWNVLNEEDNSAKLKEQMKLIKDKPLVDGYEGRSVVYEIMTKEGFDLNSSVVVSDAKQSLWTVNDGERKMIVSFASKLSIEQIDSFGFVEGDLFVCLDSALDDTTKVNILRRKFSMKVI